MNVEFIRSNVVRFTANAQRFMGKQGVAKAWASELYCLARFGCSPDDFFRYEFYRKSGWERNRFITYARSQRLIHTYNDSEYIRCFCDKASFNREFSGFIGREWIDLSNCDRAQVEDFVRAHGEVLVKPSHGGQGKGIFKLASSELEDFDLDAHRNCVAEEFIRQHPKLAELNASSVNTVRTLTFKGNVVACALRIGGDGALVDNLHSNGVCAHLDIDSGMIDGPCVNNKLDKFLFHPSTGRQLVGYRVPNWKQVITTAQEAAKVVPQVQYVGWDIAVTEDGTALIEGNHDPGHDVVQMIAQTGLYETIRALESE